MARIIPRPSLDWLPAELRHSMDHTQPHVILFDLDIPCGAPESAEEIKQRGKTYQELLKLHPEFDDDLPF